MEIKFLGTGGAFDYTKGTSAAIVRCGDKSILIDCGMSIFAKLRENELITEIDHLLVTHLHGDHIGGLMTFLAYYEKSTGNKMKLIYPSESFKQELEQLLALTFESKRVEYVSIEAFDDIGFIDTFGQHVPEMQSFAYYFKDGDKLIYYSGDLGVLDTTANYLESRREQNIRVFQDINAKEVPSHVHYKEASEQLKGYEAYGYHCDKATMPSDNTLPLVEDFPELNY